MTNFEKRIKEESKGLFRVTNNSLRCRDCVYRLDDSEVFGNTSQCKQYILKPGKVLKGEDCEKYEREITNE